METNNKSGRKLKKTLLIISGVIVLFVLLVILFISPLTKYMVEKYDEKYTGRQITMDWAYVNVFTGYLHFSNLKLYEQKNITGNTEKIFGKSVKPGDSIFFSANGISLNFEILKAFSKTYEISQLTLDNPKSIVIQNDSIFNFTDILEKFSPKEVADTLKKETLHLNILNVKVKNGEFHYRERRTPVNYFIKNFDFESDGKKWDVDTIAGKFSFTSGIGTGDVKGNCMVNIKNNDYRLTAIIKKFDINLIAQYVQDLTNYGSMSGNIDANIRSRGNLKDRTDVTNAGLLTLNDFHFGKQPGEDYISIEKLNISVKEVSPQKLIYDFDSLTVTKPYLKYERYDYLDNLQTMFGKKGSNIKAVQGDPKKFNLAIEIAEYVRDIGRNILRSNYKIGRLAVYKGNIKYNDYKLNEKFSIQLFPFDFLADSIDKKYKHVDLSIKSAIQPYGNMVVKINVNPKDSSDFDLYYNINKIPTTLFNPYSITYTSFPMDRGTIELFGNWHVRNGNINSMNHLILIDPRLSDRQKANVNKWLPMRLIMFFVRERGNVIDYEVPIKGNLGDPKFNVWDVIVDVITNIFIKPPTTPYRMEVRSIEQKIEKSLKLNWEMRSNDIQPEQEKFLREIADFLKNNKEAKINVTPQVYEAKEKEYILFNEAKKKYYLAIHSKKGNLSPDEEKEIDKMSVKDSAFVSYLRKQIKDSLLFTIQEKCYRYVGSDIVNKKYRELNEEREKSFKRFFNEEGIIKQISISKSHSVIPYNGFSFYKIDYKGDFPPSLLEAYRKMNELNNKPPREKFKNERKKYSGTI